MPDSSLNARRRARELEEIASGDFRADVLVVGLGATGAGAALDAASRGLSVVAVDAGDLAFGSSRWSSKLVHGGLRYLAAGQLGVAVESAVERDVLIRSTAPHLVRALPMVLPFAGGTSRVQHSIAHAGLRAGDVLRRAAGTPASVLPRACRLPAAAVAQLVPGVRREGLRGGVLSFEGQLVDDARLVVALARTAAAHGARIITRCRALELDGAETLLRDELSGFTFALRARAVVNAAGVWAGQLAPAVRLRPSRGTHIVLEQSVFGELRTALTVPIPGERNRYVFALPQADGLVYAGLTDEELDGPLPDVPEPPEHDIEFLLGALSPVLASPLGRADVIGAFAGLRPLLQSGTQARTADLSRSHAIVEDERGVVTVVGGKLTTYRRMAQDAIDAAVRRAQLLARPCRTREIPLVGARPATGEDARRGGAAGTGAGAPTSGAPARLVRRYGSEAPRLAALEREHEALAQRVVASRETTLAELLWGIEHEGALLAEDLVERRTRLSLVEREREAALRVAQELLAGTPRALATEPATP